MVFSFSREEVRGQLKDFGLENVSEEKLDEFMHDLKRLVKYDEKQQRLRNEGKVKTNPIVKRTLILITRPYDS